MLKQKFSTFLNQQNWMLRHIYKRKKNTQLTPRAKVKTKQNQRKKNEKREKRELQQQLRRKEFVQNETIFVFNELWIQVDGWMFFFCRLKIVCSANAGWCQMKRRKMNIFHESYHRNDLCTLFHKFIKCAAEMTRDIAFLPTVIGSELIVSLRWTCS